MSGAMSLKAKIRNIAGSKKSPELKAMWEKYRRQFSYAAGIEYCEIIEVLKALTDQL